MAYHPSQTIYQRGGALSEMMNNLLNADSAPETEFRCFIDIGVSNGQTRYLTAVNGGCVPGFPLHTGAYSVSETEEFELVQYETDKYKLKAFNGLYLKIKTYSNPDTANTLPIHTDAVWQREWETFTLCKLENGKIAFKVYNGTNYLTAKGRIDDDNPFVALTDKISEAADINIIFQNGKTVKDVLFNNMPTYKIFNLSDDNKKIPSFQTTIIDNLFSYDKFPFTAVDYIGIFPVGMYLDINKSPKILDKDNLEYRFEEDFISVLDINPKSTRTISERGKYNYYNVAKFCSQYDIIAS
ncbi:MAG: hypothetical protein LBM93_01415, partial [Oscillospiraceae bacterium]|nr:hypothetical protein [Oscillospiraceae bacterium]